MNTLLNRLKGIFHHAFPTILFFFIVFQLLAFSRGLVLKAYHIHIETFFTALMGALIIGKVVLLANHLTFMNRFSNKPLIYNICWKTTIYLLGALLVHYAEHLLPYVRQHSDIATANQHLLQEIVWPHFWLTQLWLLICFTGYCTITELSHALGSRQLRKLMFG